MIDELSTATFDHESVRRLPFATAPCQCVKRHVPRPLTTELHHLFPQSLQRRIFGRVQFKETVPLCGTAHNTVHLMFDALMRDGPVDNRGNGYLWSLAIDGYRLYRNALVVAGHVSGGDDAGNLQRTDC